MSRRHILHAVLSMDMGGLERAVVSLVKQGVGAGDRVTVLCIEKPGALAEMVAHLGGEVVSIGKPPGLRLSTIMDVRNRLRRLRPDVLHTHQLGALFYAGPAGVRRVIHTEHGVHFHTRRTRMLGRWSARFADKFACVSQDICDAVRSAKIVPERKLIVVPNGIDTTALANPPTTWPSALQCIPPGAPVVGTIGRLAEVKRQDRLIDAALQLPGVHVVLVGDGPEREALQRRAAPIGDRVHFVGQQDRPQDFLHRFDLFALTSRSEGMPLSILEAHAAGKPVVAFAVGGVPECVRHGIDGMLVNDLPEFVAAVKRVLADPRDFGSAGRKRVCETADVRIMAAAYDALYRGG